MTDATRPLVVLAGYTPDDDLPVSLTEALEGDGVELVAIHSPAAAAAYIAKNAAQKNSVPDVVLLRGDGMVDAAKIIRNAAPTAQLTFLAGWRERSLLQAAMRSADLGHGWSFALPDSITLADSIREAITSSTHRRSVRTTLDRRPVRVSAQEMSAQRVRDLAISDALLRSIMRDSVDAIVITDDRGRIIGANPASSALLGYGEELMRVDVATIIPRADDLATLAGKVTELEVKAADGTLIPVDATVSKVTVGTTPGGYTIAARDARERIAAQREMQRQIELTSTIMDGIAEGVYVIDAFGNLLFMNRAAEDLLGWKRDDLARRNVHDTIHPGTEASECPLLQAVRRGVPLRTQETFVRKDGTTVPVECAVTPVRLHETVVGGVFNFHDLTAFRAAQERLQAEKEALSQMNRVKDDFIATVSHELRTPLTAILGWLQLVSKGADAEEMSEALEVIESSARAQAQIVEDLLDVSRIISGKLHLNVARVGIGDVVTSATSTLQPFATQKNIALEIVDRASGSTICGDPARLNQIVWNLVSNAIKFTPSGGIVSVAIDADGPMARITVRDTGVGIPPDVLPKIFDPYRQAEGATAKGGLGLGLAIVRTLVDLHHGRIAVESELKRGTTFTVELPREAETGTAAK